MKAKLKRLSFFLLMFTTSIVASAQTKSKWVMKCGKEKYSIGNSLKKMIPQHIKHFGTKTSSATLVMIPATRVI